MPKTSGVSPKLVHAAVVGVITWALTKFAISIDSTLEQAINVVAMLIAAYWAGPGDVVPVTVGAPSDEGLSMDAQSRLAQIKPGE